MRRAGLLLVLLALPALGTPFSWPSPYRLQDSFDSPAHPGRLARYLTPSGDTVSFSGVTFTRSSSGAACTASDGTVTFPASGVPCLAGGYHARPAIANLLTYSEQLDNAAWTKASVTAIPDAAVAPDGTTTAEKLVASAASAQHYALESPTVSASTTYSFSAYVKAGEITKVGLQMPTLSGAFPTNTYDLQAGTVSVSGVTGATGSIEALGNGWFRALMSIPEGTGASTARVAILLMDASGNATFTGDGVSGAYIWGAQLVPGSLPLDYCPSGSTPATCAAEVMTVPTPSGMSLTSGCAKVCVTPPWTGGTSASAPTIYVLDGNAAATARLLFLFPGSMSFTATDGTHTVASPTTLGSAGQRVCYATRWSASAGALSIDSLTSGTAGTPSAFTAFPSFDSTIAIGNHSGAQQPLGAVIDSIIIGSAPGACQ